MDRLDEFSIGPEGGVDVDVGVGVEMEMEMEV